MNPFVLSNNLYSLYIAVTYKTSLTKPTYGDVTAGHRHLWRQLSSLYIFPGFLFFFLSFLLDII